MKRLFNKNGYDIWERNNKYYAGNIDDVWDYYDTKVYFEADSLSELMNILNPKGEFIIKHNDTGKYLNEYNKFGSVTFAKVFNNYKEANSYSFKFENVTIEKL